MTKTFEQMSAWERNSYKDGIAQEDKVAQLLEAAGFTNVKKGTRQQDLYYDIDLCALDENGEYVTISVKSNTPKYFSADFLFELFFVYANNPEKEVPSWYTKGKADYYAVYKRHYRGGGELYLMKKKDIVEFVEQNGWQRVLQQTSKVAQLQLQHKGILKTVCGILDKPRLVAAGIAKLVADDIPLN